MWNHSLMPHHIILQMNTLGCLQVTIIDLMHSNYKSLLLQYKVVCLPLLINLLTVSCARHVCGIWQHFHGLPFIDGLSIVSHDVSFKKLTVTPLLPFTSATNLLNSFSLTDTCLLIFERHMHTHCSFDLTRSTFGRMNLITYMYMQTRV